MPRNDLFAVDPERLAEIHRERQAEMQRAARLAPMLRDGNLVGSPRRSPFAAPALYLTVTVAALLASLADAALRQQ
jgi:hypothetical protein